jgi:hypothetical protein
MPVALLPGFAERPLTTWREEEYMGGRHTPRSLQEQDALYLFELNVALSHELANVVDENRQLVAQVHHLERELRRRPPPRSASHALSVSEIARNGEPGESPL